MSYIRLHDKGLSTTLVVMSSAEVPVGKFSGSRAFSDFDANLIFVNCPSSSWYLSPIPGLGDTFYEIADSLRRSIESINTSRLVFYGGSMGGFGALAYGSYLDADLVVATGVEVVPGIEGGFYNRYNASKQYPPEIPDVVSIVSASSSKIVLFAGEESSIDLFCVRKLLPFNHVVINTIINGEHVVPKFLHQEFGIQKILDSLVTGKKNECLSYICGNVLAYEDFVDILYRYDHCGNHGVDFLDACKRFIPRLDPISLSYYLYRASLVYKRQSNSDESHKLLRTAAELNGANSKIISMLGQSFFDAKEYELSLTYATRAIEMSNPLIGKPNYNAYFCQANCFKKLGLFPKAFQSLKNMHDYLPRSGPIRKRFNIFKDEMLTEIL